MWGGMGPWCLRCRKREAVSILPLSNYERTDEQREIITAARNSESFAVRAYAGAGKTSTLRAIGAELTSKRVLYLAFNRDIVREGKAVFPSTTKVATGHAFARHELVTRYAARIEGDVPTLEARVRKRVQLPSRRGDIADERELLAERIGDLIERFAYGPQTQIAPDGDPEAAAHARAIWSEIHAERAVHPSDHDLYVKLFYVLQCEHEHPHLGFDVILYDECQDCTGSMFGTARGQAQTQQIYMGDPAQAIYAFRGAVNAFSFIDDLALYPLTMSFRFGTHIATLADRILDAAGRHFPIRTLPRRSDRVVASHEQCPEPTVILTRSQQQVLDTALGEYTRGRKVAIVGTLEAARLQQLGRLATDVYVLREGGQPPRLAKFASFQTLKWYAEKKNVAQLRIAVALVERFGDRVPELLETLRTQVVPQEQADVIVATAHAFKGRQGVRVRIAGDFRPFASKESAAAKVAVDRQELHLAYVTVTRAQSVLDMTDFREPLLSSLLAVGAEASLSGIVTERVKLGTGITKIPHALSRLVGNAGSLHAPEASIRVAVPSTKARAAVQLAAVRARLKQTHRKPVGDAPLQSGEFTGTFLEALPVTVTAGYAFIEGADGIAIVPIDGSTLRTVNILRGKRVIARGAPPSPAWTLRVTSAEE